MNKCLIVLMFFQATVSFAQSTTTQGLSVGTFTLNAVLSGEFDYVSAKTSAPDSLKYVTDPNGSFTKTESTVGTGILSGATTPEKTEVQSNQPSAKSTVASFEGIRFFEKNGKPHFEFFLYERPLPNSDFQFAPITITQDIEMEYISGSLEGIKHGEEASLKISKNGIKGRDQFRKKITQKSIDALMETFKKELSEFDVVPSLDVNVDSSHEIILVTKSRIKFIDAKSSIQLKVDVRTRPSRL